MELTPQSINPNAEAVTPKFGSTADQGAQDNANAEAVTPESQSTAAESVDEEAKEGAEETTQETVEAETEVKDYKKTLEERAAEIAEQKVRETLEQIERERVEKQQQEIVVPPELDYERMERDIALSHIREKELISIMEADPDNIPREVLAELRQIRSWRQIVETESQKYEKERLEALQKKEAETRYTEYWKAENAAIDEILSVMQKTYNIPSELFQKGRETWRQMVAADPLLQQRFDEGIRSGRRTETVQWAWNEAKKKMETQTAESLKEKEDGKGKQIGSDNNDAETSTVSVGSIKTWDALMKLDSKDINKFAREHPKAFQKLKDQKFR